MPPAWAGVSGPLGAVAADPVGLRARHRAWGGQGYSLLLGLVNAAPEVGDLQTTQGTHLQASALSPCPGSSGLEERRPVSLTHSWRPELDTWAMTYCSPRAGHLPARLCRMWRRARAGGGLANTAPTWRPELRAPRPSRSLARLLPPADRPGEVREARASLRRRRRAAGQPRKPPGGRQGGGGGGGEDPGTSSGFSVPAAADTRNDPGFRHARGPPCMNTRAWSRVDPGYLQLGQHLHSGPDVHDLERPRWLGGWVGGRGFGALRAQGQPGPSSGEPLCTRVLGPALPAQHEWGQSGCSEAHFQGRLGALTQSMVPPHLGRRGRVSPEEGGEIQVQEDQAAPPRAPDS